LRKRDLALARDQLIRKIDRLADALAPTVELVFDGRAASRERFSAGRVSLVFAPADKTADTVIERMVSEDPAPAEVCVVASDRMEIDTVTAAGAQAMSCASFLEWIERADRRVRNAISRPAPTSRFTLGDVFPD
jgi:predicted RNA-binding protein with PIN domain